MAPRRPDDIPPPLPSAEDGEVVGGIPFFLSLAALLPTGALFTFLAIVRVRYSSAENVVAFITATGAGAFLAKILIRKHISVLIHEFKHSLVANLVGNKHKDMKIEENSGYYQWLYTPRTAHYNAFIALAPYITPVFTFLAVLFVLSVAGEERILTIILVGVGYGMDLMLNIRDISPIQTDISLIRGGYKVGVLYIIGWNLLLAGLVLTWAFNGTDGLVILFEDIATCFVYLYFSIFGFPSQP